MKFFDAGVVFCPREYYASELKLSRHGCQSKKGNSGRSVAVRLHLSRAASAEAKQYHSALVRVAEFEIKTC